MANVEIKKKRTDGHGGKLIKEDFFQPDLTNDTLNKRQKKTLSFFSTWCNIPHGIVERIIMIKQKAVQTFEWLLMKEIVVIK